MDLRQPPPNLPQAWGRGKRNFARGSSILKDNWPLPALLAAQVFINLPGILGPPLWVDEAYSAIMARRALGEIWRSMVYDAGPPLYYLMLHGWRLIFGESEAALRGMSLLFALFTTIGVYLLGNIHFDKKTASFASLLWICAPLCVYNAGQARNYTLFSALSVGLALAALFYGRERRKWTWAASLALLTAAAYTHNAAWFMALALFAGLWALDRGEHGYAPLWKWGILLIGVLLFYLPWTPTLMAQMRITGRTIGWVEKAWSPWAIGWTMNALIPGGAMPAYIDLPALPAYVYGIMILLWAAPLVPALMGIMKPEGRMLRFTTMLFLAGLAGPYLYSLVGKPVYLVGRTDFFLAPFWCLLAGAAVARLRWQWLGNLLLSVLAAQSLGLSMYMDLRDQGSSEWDIVRYLERQGKPDDAVLCTGLTRPPIEYYLQPKGFRILSDPRDMAQHLAHLNEEWYAKNVDLNAEARECVEDAKSFLSGGGRLWVIGSERRINEPLFEQLAREKSWRGLNRVETPKMGLRKIGEPLFILPYMQANNAG